jgi:hypothetical protein
MCGLSLFNLLKKLSTLESLPSIPQEMPHFLQRKSLFLFGLDKRIDGKDSSVDNFFSKLNKDNPHILQQQVC